MSQAAAEHELISDAELSRADLGALFTRLSRTMIAAEMPILAKYGLEMWDYIILTALGSGAAGSQKELAALAGRDKTRLIKTLDALERQRLIQRTPDPGDRRRHTVAFTPEGRERYEGCRREIRRMEQEFLAGLGEAARRLLVDSLIELSDRQASDL